MSIVPGIRCDAGGGRAGNVLATAAHQPYFDFTLAQCAGSIRGFFWFDFLTSKFLRFLNLALPAHYTRCSAYVLLLHFAWASQERVLLRRLSAFRGASGGAAMRVSVSAWIGSMLGFFSLSNTRNTIPARYRLLRLLIGSAMRKSGDRAGGISRARFAAVRARICVKERYFSPAAPTCPGDIPRRWRAFERLYDGPRPHGRPHESAPLVSAGSACVAGLALLIGELGG